MNKLALFRQLKTVPLHLQPIGRQDDDELSQERELPMKQNNNKDGDKNIISLEIERRTSLASNLEMRKAKE